MFTNELSSAHFPMRTVTLHDGIDLAVRDTGPADAPHTVVFLHGFCLSHASWSLQTRHLRSRYGATVRVIAYDHRGHGHSAAAPMNTYRIDQLGDDLAQVLAELEVGGKVTLVGHSMGGMTALAYLGRPAAERPVNPDGLVLVATAAGRLTERGAGRLLSGPAAPALYGLIDHTPARMLRSLTEHVSGVLQHRCSAHRGTTFAGVDFRALMSTPVPTAVGFLPGLREHDQYDALATITARTVVVSGTLDPLTPSAHARELADGIGDARHVQIPGAGHMLPSERPQVVNAAIRMAMNVTAATRPSEDHDYRASTLSKAS